MDLFKRLKFLFLFIAVISAGCNNNSNVTSQQREWSTQIINSSDMITKSLYPASINGCQDVEIRPQIQGRIEEIKIKEGENVRKGQILFIIEQLPYKAALN